MSPVICGLYQAIKLLENQKIENDSLENSEVDLDIVLYWGRDTRNKFSPTLVNQSTATERLYL